MNSESPCTIDVAYGDDRGVGLPVSLGVPFAQGQLTDTSNLAVTAPAGQPRPSACRPLVHWPDGSVRWGLLTFTACDAGNHELIVGQAPTVPDGPVTLVQNNDTWTIDNTRLSVTVGAGGSGPIHQINCDGHTYLDDPARFAFCVDDADTRHEPQRTVRVLEQSPLRVRLRVEGAHFTAAHERRLTYRLDVELWAGWTTLRLDYHFFNVEAGRASVPIERLACEAQWSLTGPTQRHFLQQVYGLFYVGRHVFNPSRVAIIADEERQSAYVEDAAMLLDDVDYPFYLNPPLVGTADWLGLHGGGRAVYLQMQDFLRARPNRLVSEGATLNLEIWPATKEVLDLPQGRSRRQVMTLAFVQSDDATPDRLTGKMNYTPSQAPEGIASMLASPICEGRACLAPEWLAGRAAFEQDLALPRGRHLRFDKVLADLANISTPDSKFDVGDMNSQYHAAYSVSGGGLVRQLPGAPEIPRNWPEGRPTQTYLDCHEPVWLNNEYDVIHTLCGELMRLGRHDLWNMVRLVARHNIEVDFLHYSDHLWLHRATPAHSARHTTTGAYPSHFWTQGLLEYYCLSGDPDALEVALALGDKTVEFFANAEQREVLWGFNREIGWSILLLAHLYDITREPRFLPLLEEMIDFVMGFDRNAFSGAVNLSSGNDRLSLHRQMINGFFGYASMVDAVDRYATITGRTDVDQWLQTLSIDLAKALIIETRDGGGVRMDFGIFLAVGYERTGDPRFMTLTEAWLDQLCWNSRGPVGHATTCRGWARILGHAWRHGILDKYEVPSAGKLEDLASW